ncbi:MAG: glycosyltransferase [Candidatus Levybacteria bacterium]|nr:glycosyltransferase [Candidatus Levybacteria bacterium]
MKRPNSKLTLSILLPVRNEGINIHLMLKILEAVLEIPHEILIIYDDKADDTIPAIREIRKKNQDIRLVYNHFGKGVINAIKAGIDSANGKYILILAVDDVGPTLAIEDMIYLMDHGCEFVSCTRYRHGGRRLGGSLLESFLSQIANRLFRLLCGSIFSDATTGFKMFRKDITKKIILESKPVGWAVVFEMAMKAQIAGLHLGEVPIISIDRLYGGKSTFRIGPWMKEYFRWFVYGAKHFRELHSNRELAVRVPKATIAK